MSVITSSPNSSLPSRFLTVEEVCWVLNVGATTVRKWVKQKRLAYFKDGAQVLRFDPQAVMEFIRSKTIARKALSGTYCAPLEDEDWERLERLIVKQIRIYRKELVAA